MMMQDGQTRYSFTSLALAVFLTALIVGAGAYWFFTSELRDISDSLASTNRLITDAEGSENGDMEEPAAPTEPSATYANNQFGFSFDYPERYEVKVYNASNLTVGTITGSGLDEFVDGAVEVRVVSVDEDSPGLNLQSLLDARIPPLCDADGGGVSISCPGLVSIEALPTTSGNPAYAITMMQEERTFLSEPSVETSERTFYAVQIDTDPVTAVIFYAIGTSTNDLARSLALSVR